MFEINNKNYIQYQVNETSVYEIEDFYKYPDKIVEFISNLLPRFHKISQQGSLNGNAFEDLRHSCDVIGLREVKNFLSSICKQKPHLPDTLETNMFKFLDKKFITCDNNWWWPHRDRGYTALVYLNKISHPGTNLYDSSDNDYLTYIENNLIEHSNPWQPKSKFKLEATLQAKYNKLVLFDGMTNPHSMSIDNDFFSDQYRLNQVMFFIDTNKKNQIFKEKKSVLKYQ